MTFSLNLSGHINGAVEEAKHLEQEIVDELHKLVDRLRADGHSASGQFYGQHVQIQQLGGQDTGTGTVPAPADGLQADEEPDGAPTGAVQNLAQTEPDQPVAITSEGVRDAVEPNPDDEAAGETGGDADEVVSQPTEVKGEDDTSTAESTS